MSIFCERRARPYEVSPPRQRRGWWGNTVRTDNHEDGSRLWLLEQSRLTVGTLRLMEAYTEEALQWFISDVDLKTFTVNAEAVLDNNEPSVRLNINLLRKNNASESYYFTVWSNTK
ncbi:MAG: phage GP46 family protein [Chitinophagaceae bacterium]|nr:phage GP46 family protein [Chitinophagaceae bacterium]